MLHKVNWNIVADGVLFKGSFVVAADDAADAIERARAALGREGGAATFSVKDTATDCLDLGRSEYAADRATEAEVPHINQAHHFGTPARFVFDVAARAKVIAETEEDALRKLGHALQGKQPPSVKYMRTKVEDPEPLGNLSTYERHLLEKQFRAVRVAST